MVISPERLPLLSLSHGRIPLSPSVGRNSQHGDGVVYLGLRKKGLWDAKCYGNALNIITEAWLAFELQITARQRWTPTPVQLQIPESIFEQGNGTPSEHRKKFLKQMLVI
ncbi:hypothetical protein MRB53_026439 [Persea americana]|uniref:Uncharacterized protein n=1 Tax=Persea americana TaxID=3435 RepID=A0ACC2LJ05_PERAE|nr:hypothetical protein MRB53_026439 [Persea americana]